MDKQPSVSIYIIAYLNSEERCNVLKRTCEGALAQRYPDFEVVVSDNGGSHAVQDALSSIQDPRLKMFRHKENVGFAGNINRCVELCEHEIIKPLCDDDLIHPDFLAQTVPWVDRETLVVADVEKYLLGKDPEAISHAVTDQPGMDRRPAGYRRDIWGIPYSSSCIPSATVFHRDFFRGLGGYDGKTITADYDFFVEACVRGTVVHIKQTLCHVGVWEGSLTEEMAGKPFFFPTEEMYTKFRILHCANISANARAALLLRLLWELVWQGTRLVKHPLCKVYRNGYIGYLRRFSTLLLKRKKSFGPLLRQIAQH
jgi:glycosyltransferase involved in cell wall biosynthesis